MEEAREKALLEQEKTLAKQLEPLQRAYDDAMRVYLKNSAAQLAASLQEHEPCPVSVSYTHLDVYKRQGKTYKLKYKIG